MTNNNKFKWWHGILFVVAVNGVSYLLNKNKSPEILRKEYKTQKQAPWAPPAKAFFPAWVFNNITQVLGNVRLLNKKDYPDRNLLLGLNALMWLDFVSFGKVSTGLSKPSNILSLIWTEFFKLVSLVNLITTWKGQDKKMTLSILPSALWGLFASTLAWYQALANKDKLFNVELIEENNDNLEIQKENDKKVLVTL